ncbi:MAG: thermopsin family protease [Thermoplasmatales archaeon]
MNHFHASSTYSNSNIAQIVLNKYYSAEPAPMGIADYGIGPNGKPYEYNTSSFMGNVTINSISMYSPSLNTHNVTFQLNLNMVFYYHSIIYDYWVQDVAVLNTSSMEITFIDNIWNLSSPNANMLNSTILGNGTVAGTGSKSGSSQFYYDLPNSSLPGNNVTLKNNSSFQLRANAYLGHNNSPEVSFLYNDGYGWIVYDNAVFHFATEVTNGPYFQVNGYDYNPAYTYYDAELVIGGPGNSSETNNLNSSILLMLEYYNGNNFQSIRNAFNFGSDTGETVYGVVSEGTYGSITGRLAAYVVNGLGLLGAIYYSNDLSSLRITTDISSGALYVKALNYSGSSLNVTSFVGGIVNVTLFPGNYSVQIYDFSSGTFQNYGNVTLSPGRQTNLPNDLYEVKFNETGLPSGSGWYLNISNTSLSSGLINGTQYIAYLKNGTYNYTVSSADKDYRSSNVSGTFFINGSSQIVPIKFIPVLFKIYFVESGLPNGSLWSVTLNGRGTLNSSNNTVIFYVTNATYDYIIPSIPDYSPSNHTGSVKVSGSDVRIPILFTIIDGYLVGKISPSGAIISINGATYSTSNGNFNISLPPGNYSLNISAQGYVSFTTNVTIVSMQATHLPIISLLKKSNDIFTFEVVVFSLVILVGIWSFLRSRKRH